MSHMFTLLQGALENKPVVVAEAFNNLVQEQVASLIEAKRAEVMNSLVTEGAPTTHSFRYTGHVAQHKDTGKFHAVDDNYQWGQHHASKGFKTAEEAHAHGKSRHGKTTALAPTYYGVTSQYKLGSSDKGTQFHPAKKMED